MAAREDSTATFNCLQAHGLKASVMLGLQQEIAVALAMLVIGYLASCYLLGKMS
jgi:ABC-type proline/glycine betaine transport system permease subunit